MKDDDQCDEMFPFFELLGEAFARGSDPGTSHEAAESVRGKEANRMELEVLAELKSWPDGLTSHELVEVTGISWQSLTPRIRPLIRKGLVEDSGIRRPGPTRRSTIVWKAK